MKLQIAAIALAAFALGFAVATRAVDFSDLDGDASMEKLEEPKRSADERIDPNREPRLPKEDDWFTREWEHENERRLRRLEKR